MKNTHYNNTTFLQVVRKTTSRVIEMIIKDDHSSKSIFYHFKSTQCIDFHTNAVYIVQEFVGGRLHRIRSVFVDSTVMSADLRFTDFKR